MALTPEDKAEIAQLIVAAQAAQTAQVPQEPEPEPPPVAFYVHLADGRVIETGDSASTHIDGVQVIGRYPLGG
jgi:hypothetical protein